MISVSECAKRFAHALSNPWGPDALGACLPMSPVRPSMKLCQRMRISTVVGTNGGCFLLVSPCLVNNQAFAWYSTTGYVQADNAAFTVTGTNASTGVGVVAANMATIPWSNAQFADVANRMGGRIVAVGVKAMYTGTALNMSGTWNAVINHDGTSLNDLVGGSSYNIPNLSNERGFKTAPVTRKPMVVTSGPLDYQAYDFNEGTDTYPWSVGQMNGQTGGSNGAAPIFIMLTGGVANQGVIFDIIAHFEYVGKLANSITPSHLDENAARALLAASVASNQSSNWHPTFGQLMNGLKTAFTTGTQIVSAVRSAAPLLRGAAAAAPLLLT